jgi:hypothetical protein
LTRASWILLCAMLFTAGPVATCGWWTSMYTASCLVRDATINVIKFVRSTNPCTTEWELQVSTALVLVDKLESLSDGWADGLAGLTGTSGCFALSFLLKSLDNPWLNGTDEAIGWTPGTQRYLMLLYTAIFGALPFLIAMELAVTSSYCDILMNELNEARKRYGASSHLKLQWLETTYGNLVRTTQHAGYTPLARRC